MFDKLNSYLWYILRAKSAHGIHSPFVFDFYNEVLHDKRYFTVFDDIEILREELIHDLRLIEVNDYGAGGFESEGQGIEKKTISVAEIASRTSITKREGELLFKMVEHYNPPSILELGTSLGISTLYLAMQNSHHRVVSLEGSSAIAEIAKENFNMLAIPNIRIVSGRFEETLSQSLVSLQNETKSKIGMAFIDGDHRYEPTMNYFQTLLPQVGDNSFLVFHDINWSKEMQRAWKEIVSNRQVSISIDIYQMGIVFFRPNMGKQHFVLRW